MKSNLVRNLTWLDLRSCQKQKKEEEKTKNGSDRRTQVVL